MCEEGMPTPTTCKEGEKLYVTRWGVKWDEGLVNSRSQQACHAQRQRFKAQGVGIKNLDEENGLETRRMEWETGLKEKKGLVPRRWEKEETSWHPEAAALVWLDTSTTLVPGHGWDGTSG